MFLTGLSLRTSVPAPSLEMDMGSAKWPERPFLRREARGAHELPVPHIGDGINPLLAGP